MKKIVILLMSVLVLLSFTSCKSIDATNVSSLTLGTDAFFDDGGIKAGGAFTFEYWAGKTTSPISYVSRLRLSVPMVFNKPVAEVMGEYFYFSFDEDVVYTKKLGIPKLHVGGGAGVSPVIGANLHAALGLGFDVDEKLEIAFMTFPTVGYNFMPNDKENKWYYGLSTNVAFKFLQNK